MKLYCKECKKIFDEKQCSCCNEEEVYICPNCGQDLEYIVLKNDELITVCAECYRATCWYGEFMCDKARDAGIIQKTVAELRKLNREHEDHWIKQVFDY